MGFPFTIGAWMEPGEEEEESQAVRVKIRRGKAGSKILVYCIYKSIGASGRYGKKNEQEC
jgi:hypothetical protein